MSKDSIQTPNLTFPAKPGKAYGERIWSQQRIRSIIGRRKVSMGTHYVGVVGEKFCDL
jgi:hypothetical protein